MARVLLVDDEETILVVLSAVFRSQGYSVVMAQDGHKAIDLIKSEEFDLMVCDVRMEPIDGMQLLSLATECRPLMPVIMVTAYYSAKIASDAKEKGAFAFLKKPFNSDELMRVAQEALEHGVKLREKSDKSRKSPKGK